MDGHHALETEGHVDEVDVELGFELLALVVLVVLVVVAAAEALGGVAVLAALDVFRELKVERTYGLEGGDPLVVGA